MKFDLVITDYDGTLGDFNGIKEETVKAIKEYIGKGGKFCVCSGRPFQSIKQILNTYGINKGLCGCLQGSIVCDLETGEEIYCKPINKQVACDIISDMEKDGMIPTVWTKDVLYYSKPNRYEAGYVKLNCIKVQKVSSLQQTIIDNNLKVLKIAAIYDDNLIDGKRKIYDLKFGYEAVFNSGAKDVFETVNKFSTKATDVKIISEKYNIPFEKIMTVGDSTNDLEMIDGEWYGVAVGNAKEEVKKVAKEITISFEDQPIKFLLEKYCLKD